MRALHSKLVLFLIAILLYSCHQDLNHNKSISTRDSILNQYLKVIDTLPYYDTANQDYQFLRAYALNDTSTLKNIRDYHTRFKTIPWIDYYLDSSATSQDFSKLNADEAYSFGYYASFCPYYTVTTIFKSGEVIKINSIVYQNADSYDSIPCKIVEQTMLTVDSLSWEKFKESLEVADFWGLKEDNGYHGVDGSSLNILGFQKVGRGHKERRAYVTRWNPHNLSITGSFIMLLRFSKIKSGCLTPG